MRVIGFAGWSGSGKTTLIVKLIPVLMSRGLSVSTLKHAHHSLEVDRPGKDSYLHREAGAREVLVASANRWALMHELREEDEPRLVDLLRRLSEVDLVIVEGFKREAHMKIEVHRKEIGKAFLFPEDCNIVALVSDTPPTFPEQPHLPLDSGSHSASLRASGDVAEMLPFASINDVEAVCDLVMQSAVPLNETLRRLQKNTNS
ncbi:MAG: molybdopterin-guanine dinucleotide biosynthesis adapter protein [Methylobacteriaceae bacterium]|jgi:molybdopterin-guanine dinucleotide biosynthesis protein B|nr:molybdopterin-guanine dinucleotide biosynthesis adapter protein [Methylobacteriaceae bacterium]